MNELATLSPHIPDFLRVPTFLDSAEEISSGLPVGSWPKISIRSNRFNLQEPDGTEVTLEALHLDMILVRANPHLSKLYYANDYNSSGVAPDCWADNGYGPGPRVRNPVSTVCQTCEKNAWGSEISKISGKGIKACADVKKLSVLVVQNGQALPKPYEFDIKPGSLGNLAAIDKFVRQNGARLSMVVLRVQFDPQAVGVLTFNAMSFIDQAQAALIESLRDSEVVKLELGLGDSEQQPPRPNAGPVPSVPALTQSLPPEPPTPAAPQEAPAAPRGRGRPRSNPAPVAHSAQSVRPREDAQPVQQPASGLFAPPAPPPAPGLFGQAPPPAAGQSVVAAPATSAAVDNLLADLFPDAG